METKMDLLQSPCLFAIAKKNLLNECCVVLESDCSLENSHIQVSTEWRCFQDMALLIWVPADEASQVSRAMAGPSSTDRGQFPLKWSWTICVVYLHLLNVRNGRIYNNPTTYMTYAGLVLYHYILPQFHTSAK